MKNLFYLNANDIPNKWFNVVPILPKVSPPPPEIIMQNNPRYEVLSKIRVKELLRQDQMLDTWVNIPDEVLENYLAIGRPTPIMRAYNVEKYLDTPARIYIKREDMLPTGSFKLNTAIPQVYYASKESGVKGLISETGAGQWGVALSYSCNMYNLKSIIFWVKISMQQKELRRILCKLLGANIYPSPSTITSIGKKILQKNPEDLGSLGTAIGEAISYCTEKEDYRYVSGSNLPHVLMHQTIIGLETRKQLAILGESPSALIACAGGGSNLCGFISPFMSEKINNTLDVDMIAAEADTSPRLTKGEYRYDHSDPEGVTPLILSYTLGRDYVLPPAYAGGLRQHSGSPVIGVMRNTGLLNAYAYSQEDIFKTGKLFVDYERIMPAPESCYALKAAIDLALEAKKLKQNKTIVVCCSGNGLLDLDGYKAVLSI